MIPALVVGLVLLIGGLAVYSGKTRQATTTRRSDSSRGLALMLIGAGVWAVVSPA
jgi:hypothetical protein